MKVVIAIDDSSHSDAVLNAVCKRHWPGDTQFKVLTVMEPLPIDSDSDSETVNMMMDINERRRKLLESRCSSARSRLEKCVPGSSVHYDIKEGDPKDVILTAAVEWEADRILVGAHGRGACPHFALGSVSRSVANHAHCTVEIVRDRQPQLKSA